ncbi:polysaccharide deacetylase family protein [Flavobacterium sp. MXW15]|uniref:Polysaccharide deacetylase family protein n=1 Tax=Xanthomonas chitinilytica TaxID=2989819 RepID=A0ABT3K0P4_9XANT|nr:polysaccharide deacetylase family protein [Xanthomonas sp. H13-6]MCW4456600.1 polysaccharide deacetylase family protein [Flavobacterium sp. MXW15]MCW4474302.1 polysaccharide deacetylase family protein [Xanthomonas sp. H13-6]
MKRCTTLLLAVLLLPSLPAWAGPGGALAWPDGKKAAVSLAYDDALDSQLDNAIPALDRHGFKGSFYLQLSREPVRLRLEEWRAAARNGHELGNHTLFHQCSGSVEGRDWVEPQRDLDTTAAAAMKEQVLLANVMLTAIDGKRERTFTVPCGEAMAGGEDYVDAVKDAFVAIKRGEGAVTPDMRTLDPHAVTVGAPVEASGRQLIAQVEEAARRGTMVNFTFHGIGGDYLAVSNQAHEELLAYLAAHRDVYWVETFVTLMKYVRQQQSPPGEP